MRHLAVALVAVLALGACSDDDEESADLDERSGESPQVCDPFAVLGEWNDAVEEAVTSTDGNLEAMSEAVNAALLDGREEVEAAYSDLADTVPDELRDDAEVVGDYTVGYLDLVADHPTADELSAWVDAEDGDAIGTAWDALVDHSLEQCDVLLSNPVGAGR